MPISKTERNLWSAFLDEAKIVQMYQAFEWEPPIYAHMPAVLRPDGKGKLSKRDGAVGVLEYKQKGYLPEAMVNYLSLLGWSYDDKQEIFTIPELIEKFSLERVNPSPARFSFEKLDWMNAQYLARMPVDALGRRVRALLDDAGLAGSPIVHEQVSFHRLLELLRPRARYVGEDASSGTDPDSAR